jgi:hypothetical protein
LGFSELQCCHRCDFFYSVWQFLSRKFVWRFPSKTFHNQIHNCVEQKLSFDAIFWKPVNHKNHSTQVVCDSLQIEREYFLDQFSVFRSDWFANWIENLHISNVGNEASKAIFNISKLGWASFFITKKQLKSP